MIYTWKGLENTWRQEADGSAVPGAVPGLTDHPGFVSYAMIKDQTQARLDPDRFRRKGPATAVGRLRDTGSIALIIDY